MKLLQDFKIPPNLQFCFDICFSFLQKLIRGSEKQAVPPRHPPRKHTHTHTHTLQILVFLSFGLLKTHKRSRSLECKSYFFYSILLFRLLCSECDGGGGGRVGCLELWRGERCTKAFLVSSPGCSTGGGLIPRNSSLIGNHAGEATVWGFAPNPDVRGPTFTSSQLAFLGFILHANTNWYFCSYLCCMDDVTSGLSPLS